MKTLIVRWFIEKGGGLTMAVPIIDKAKVMAKGQITLPKDIRSQLRLSTDDRVTLICEDDRVILMNSAIYTARGSNLTV